MGCGSVGDMRSFRWLIITGAVVVGVLILAIAIISLSLNSYIHSPAFKAEVETRASQSLGGPVQVQSVDFDVFRGVKLQGLVTQIDPAHAAGQGSLRVQVASVNCTYSLAELLAWKLRLTGVTLDQPQLVLTKEPAQAHGSSAISHTITSNSAATGETSSSGKSMPFQFTLDRAKVNDGNVTILDAAGAQVVDLKGVNADANTSGYYDGRDMDGTFKVATIIASGMQVKNFSTPFTYRANYLSAKPFEATAFDGNISGAYLLDGATPSILDVNAKGLDVAKILAATGAAGKLTGSLDVQSKWRGAKSGDLTGEGDAQITGGRLENVKILQEVGTILRVSELNSPTITKAQTHFVVINHETRFNALQIDSPLFQITGNGKVGFNGELNADLVLTLQRSLMTKIPNEINGSFIQKQDGSGSISFHVSGTTSDPKTNLMERIGGGVLKSNVNKIINKFFH